MRTFSLPLLFAVAALPLAAQDVTVAVIDGDPISENELNVRGQLIKIEAQAHELRLRAVENVIQRRLLEKAAAATNVTVEQLLKQEVDDKIPEPSPQEVEGFYWGQREKFNQPLEAARGQAAQMLRATKIREQRQAFVQSLRERSSVTILLEPPRLPVETARSPRRGPAAAPVTIVEFSDYQCPYCKRAQSVLKELLDSYGGRVSLVFKDLPLIRLHPQAALAAEAARCAGDQGKYWEYHDALFEAPQLQRESFSEIAKSLAVNPVDFQHCLDTRKYQAAVQRDMQEAAGLGIQSTPTFLINGILLSGAQPAESFKRIIDAELAASNPR